MDFSSIYACNNMSHRLVVWENLKRVADSVAGPWLMGGDFNEVCRATKKCSGVAINQDRVNRFA